MPDVLHLTQVRFTAAAPHDQARGLLGWVSAVLNGALQLDGLTLRRSLDDRLYIAFPGRTDRSGRTHAYVRPLDDETRRDVEHQLLAALGYVVPESAS